MNARDLIVRHFRQIVRLAASAHAAAPRASRSSGIGKRSSRSSRTTTGVKWWTNVRGPGGVSRAPLQRVRNISPVRAALPLRLDGGAGGVEWPAAGQHARVPARRCRQRAHRFRPGRSGHAVPASSTSACISSSTRTSRSSRSRCSRTMCRSSARRTPCSASAAPIPRTGSATGRAATAPTRWNGSGVTAKSSRPPTIAARAKYLAFVARYRSPCLAHHWDYLLPSR